MKSENLIRNQNKHEYYEDMETKKAMKRFTIALTTEQIRSLLDSLKKHEIIIEINYTKSYTFYDLNEAKEFFDNLMKDSIRNRTICYMEACGQG